MVMTSRTHTTLFACVASTFSDSAKLVRLPLSVVPHYEIRCQVTGVIVPTANKLLFRTNLWNSDEHERFLHGLEMFPNGPWKEVAKVVGTKSTRQTMTHAQKYRQKIERHMQAKQKVVKQQPMSRRQALVHLTSASASIGHTTTPVYQAPLPSSTVAADFMGESFSSGMTTKPDGPLASPSEVFTDTFDISFLDEEFNTLLENLDPLVNCVSI